MIFHACDYINITGGQVQNLSLSATVPTAPEFAAGKAYVYKYEALLLGGLPEEGVAKAGLKISSKVLISAAAQNVYMLKVKLKITCMQPPFFV